MLLLHGLLAINLSVALAAVAGSPLVGRQAATTITVDTSKTYQTIDGFGFS